ncbi:MAG TPA: hypothetical protein VIZ65_08705 [Cellvibrionaceae bacterium]
MAARASDFGTLNNVNIGQPKVFLGQLGEPNEDLLIPAASNASGVSFNTTTTFRVDRPLKIINAVDSGSPNGLKSAAKLIIIQSSNINLASEIELIGETADLLIITNSTTANLTCSSCSFKNFARLTLANGITQALSAVTTSIGSINLTAANGQLVIGNLTAPGVVSLELFAQNLQITGAINTNQKAVNHPAGGFEMNPNGNLIVTSGGVNIFATSLAVSYEEAKVTSTTPRDVSFTLGGSINAASVNIKVAAPLTLATTISTRGDVLANALYRGKPAPILEGITLNTLGTSQSKITNLNLNAPLSSDGIISLNAGGALNISAPLFAYQLNATTLGKTTNTNTIKSNVATFAVDNFENNSIIKAETLTVSSEKEIQNRFGGHLLASNINLLSRTSFVRNGSSMPFKPSNETFVLAKADQSNTTDLSTMVLDGLTYSGATKVANLSARILGKNIQISANNNVENINPYFVYTKNPDDWASGVPFDPYVAARVVIMAENTLKIAANQYVLNSSAIMAVNSFSTATPVSTNTVDTPFLINAPNIANERYLVKVLADPLLTNGSSTSTQYNGYTQITSSTSKDIVAKLYLYSPPGIMYSFAPVGMYFSVPGQTTALSSPGGFINNTAYFEALSDVYFMGNGSFSTLGLKLEKENFYSAQSTVGVAKECYRVSTDVNSEAYGRCMNNNTYSTTSGGTTVQADLQNTLFSVSGRIVGNSSEGKFVNHEVLDDIKSDVLTTFMSTLANSGTENVANTTGLTKYTWSESASLSSDGTQILVNRTGTLSNPYNPSAPTQNVTGGGTTYNTWDILVTKLTAIKIAFMNALDAFIAWLKG